MTGGNRDVPRPPVPREVRNGGYEHRSSEKELAQSAANHSQSKIDNELPKGL